MKFSLNRTNLAWALVGSLVVMVLGFAGHVCKVVFRTHPATQVKALVLVPSVVLAVITFGLMVVVWPPWYWF